MIYLATQKAVLISPPPKENKTAAILPPYLICPFPHVAKNLRRDNGEIGEVAQSTYFYEVQR